MKLSCVLLPSAFRSVLPAVVPGEQLVSRDAGCFLSGSVPVCSAALLALCLSRHQGPGGSCIIPMLKCPPPLHLVISYFICLVLSAQGERKCLTFYLPKLIIVGLLWLSAVTLGIWQT